jgi:hypothetical protein
MDFGVARLIRFLRKLDASLDLIPSQISAMSALSDRVATVVKFLLDEKAGILSELATTKEALATALANDAADAEAVATATAAAEAAAAASKEAEAKAAGLQELVDADAEEDAAISAALDSVTAQPE